TLAITIRFIAVSAYCIRARGRFLIKFSRRRARSPGRPSCAACAVQRLAAQAERGALRAKRRLEAQSASAAPAPLLVNARIALLDRRYCAPGPPDKAFIMRRIAMNLVSLDPHSLVLGQPLPFALRGTDGTLLANRGYVLR